ncbi:GNAT family N-acetyltransferase [Plantactinospora sp. B5E13]|uniref:GNAT family N-acetyltransferase n=1 Tax=Plantactinospora sp. B5E13 TaxID=3153758 RepID=UPI00325E8BCA
MRIRQAAENELELLREIELAAGEAFREYGMPEVADHEPPTVEALSGFRQAGRIWTAADPDDHPVAYLLTDEVDGNVHVEQVSVHPGYARRGIGRSLIEYVAGRSVADGVPALTLTTFLEVPWNAPYYRRCGFRVLDNSELTPGLRAIRAHEAALGLDEWPRVCMCRDLP